MALEDFLDSLRLASRMFGPTKFVGPGPKLKSLQLDGWLTPLSVEGYDPADFADWPEIERRRLDAEVRAFLSIARQVPPNAPAPRDKSRQARGHLEEVIKIVGSRLKAEWLEAQETMIQEAASAAKAKGWHVERDEIELEESLLGSYKAPSLLIRTWDREMRLMPVARFCAGRQGAVDLIVSPTYEREYAVTFKDHHWHIVSLRGKQNRRPFNRETFGNTISRLTQF